MEQENMEQALNLFKIVGTLKEKEFNQIQTRKGKEALSGHLVIEVKAQGKVHNHRVELFATKTTNDGNPNKMYDAYMTVKNDYKDMDSFGRDNADVIQVTGEVDYNVYKNKNGEIRENSRLRGKFPKRVEKDSVQKSEANIEVIVDGFDKELDRDDTPTGYFNVKGYTVGYKGRGIKLIGLKVNESKGMQNSVPEGATFIATITINNYTVVKEQQEETTALFGQTKEVVEAKSFVHSLQIDGGKQPQHVYTPQDLQAVKASVQEQINEAQAREISNPKDTMTTEEIDDALPF